MMDEKLEKCPICRGNLAAPFPRPDEKDVYHIRCAVCGTYRISIEAKINLRTSQDITWILSAATRSANIDANRELLLTPSNVEEVIGQVRLPQDDLERMQHLLLRLPKIQQEGADRLAFYSNRDYPLVIGRNSKEAARAMNMAIEAGYLKWYVRPGIRPDAPLDDFGGIITAKGWEYIRRTQRANTDPDRTTLRLEQAMDMAQEGSKNVAAYTAGEILEGHLRKLCVKHEISIKKPNGADKTGGPLNDDLVKKGVYNSNQQKFVTGWLGVRNSAAHAKHDEYTEEQVRSMIEGVREFIGKYPA